MLKNYQGYEEYEESHILRILPIFQLFELFKKIWDFIWFGYYLNVFITFKECSNDFQFFFF